MLTSNILIPDVPSRVIFEVVIIFWTTLIFGGRGNKIVHYLAAIG